MAKRQILIADDEPESIQVCIWYFRESGHDYDFLQAPNGEIALRLAQKYKPNLIIMDWDMPVMSGLEAVGALQKDENTKDIPIIIATGTMLHDKHLAEAFKRGAIDYVRKPLNSVELLARAKSAMALAEAHQRERELLQSFLDQKTRQLSSLALQLVQKNKFLNELLRELQDWTRPSPGQVKNAIKLIRQNIELDDDWGRFQRHFEEVHPDFFERLQQQFPQLTASDIKLCAYLRMRLENKEIAQLLNISPKGIETARYRLRKRLALPKEERLSEFIQHF